MSDSTDAEPIQQVPKPKRRTPAWVAVVLIAIAIAIFVWKLPSSNYGNGDSGWRMTARSNLKNIGLAMANYGSENHSLPARAICDKDGKPLLSWRVTILRELEEENLYYQFKLDEPWDSPNNKPLIEKMPKVYYHPKANNVPYGHTLYKAITGKNSIFDQPILKEGRWLNRWSLAELEKSPRGLSNLILCIETGDPVIWTKPEDFDCDPDKPLPAVKPQWVGGFLVVMGDGSVKSIRKDFKESALRASIDPNSTSKESLD